MVKAVVRNILTAGTVKGCVLAKIQNNPSQIQVGQVSHVTQC